VVYSWWWYALEHLVGVEPGEVMQMLTGPRLRWLEPMLTPAGVQVLRIAGRTGAGKPVVAVVRHLDGRDWEVVRAGELTGGLLAEFESWERRQ
jgi:hypothetical protein